MTHRRDAGVGPEPQSASLVSDRKGANSSRPVDVSAYNNLFVAMALGMSWQLAIVVIVPILGGYALDSKAHTSPLFVLLGLVVACLGVSAILFRTVREANARVASLETKGDKQ